MYGTGVDLMINTVWHIRYPTAAKWGALDLCINHHDDACSYLPGRIVSRVKLMFPHSQIIAIQTEKDGQIPQICPRVTGKG